MKKYLGLVVILLALIMVVGCTKDEDLVKFEGVIIEVRDNEFEMNCNVNGVTSTLIVITDTKDYKEGDKVSVTTNDLMMMSEPPRVNAINIEILEKGLVNLPCELLEIVDDEYIIVADLKATEDVVYTYKVNYSEVEKLPEVGVGTKLEIGYNGIMTKSNPPIINAESINLLTIEE